MAARPPTRDSKQSQDLLYSLRLKHTLISRKILSVVVSGFEETINQLSHFLRTLYFERVSSMEESELTRQLKKHSRPLKE